jgi:hypothetical protein
VRKGVITLTYVPLLEIISKEENTIYFFYGRTKHGMFIAMKACICQGIP